MRSLLRDLGLLRHMNWGLTAVVAVLMAVGVLFIYSACYISDDQPVRVLYKRQMLWILVGAVCYLGFTVLDYRKLSELSWWVYGLSLVLLVLVLLLGTRVYGARRWLMAGGMTIQPSELAKFAIVLVLARLLGGHARDLGRFRFVVVVFSVVTVPMLLVLKEPDLGTALIFLPVLVAMMFVGGTPIRVLGTLLAVAAAGGGLVLACLFLPEKLGASEAAQRRIAAVTGLSDYQKTRILTFFRPGRDPLGAAWNKTQSELAVSSGGPWGKGWTKGDQNILGFLPKTVTPTDFIYSVIAEEKGFFGSFGVLVLLGALVVGGCHAALMARDKAGRLLCAGVTALLFAHIFVNVAMTIGLMPIVGVPLPLLSYGGSFMVVVMSGLGVVQSVHVRSRPAVEGPSNRL